MRDARSASQGFPPNFPNEFGASPSATRTVFSPRSRCEPKISLAHDDIKKITVKLTAREIEVLLLIVRDVIELFYHKLEFASNSYKNFEEEPVREIERLVKNLAEHEKQRLEEIKRKYGV